ncbi:key lime pathogenicity protein [Colletotrichum plurivorum]|uniref:Key lime pathogenicity protein n=1 Tax=Colletotrichum plurivorum TaxID=2175906 RepID=A0A8H6JB51_9PEZI|nr:key lime pathogenicity protein [Colletotrichum plurivorum]
MPFNELQRLCAEQQQELDNFKRLFASQANQAQASQLNLYPVQGDFRAPFVQPQLHQHNAAPQGRKAAMSRSKSTMGYSGASMRLMLTNFQEHTSDMDSPQPMKRPRVMSQPMTGMSRSTSNRSEKSIPFVAKGPLAPLQTSNTANTMMDRFYQSHDDPPVMFQQPSHPLQRAPSNRRQSSLPRVEENMDYANLSVGMDITEYLAMQYDENIPSPALVPPQPAFLMPDGRHSQASCPSMSSGTSAPETIPLTRENSSFDHHIESQSLSGAFDMARINSTQSQFDFMTQDAFPVGPLGTSPLGKPESYLAHVGGAGLFPQHAQPSPMEENFLSQGSSLMERSISTNSTASTKSTQERRAKEVFQQQIQNATRTALLPKPADSGKRSQSAAAKKEGKVAVAKGTYTRPKHPKVYCDQCNEHPDGFRGDHELRRHISAKHEGVIKKFICRDPATVGIKSNVEAINPLSKCKQCISGKHYGAYYNAAAHLRRTHFKPKTPRGKNKRGDDDEKRGGKGGGDWPSMNELKSWMQEVFVSADEAASNGAEAQDEEEEEAAQFANTSIPMDLSLGHMGENMPFDMALSTSYSMPPELAAIDTQASSYLAVSDMPLSSASEAFALSPFPNSPMNSGLSHETAFSISSSNTVTPTTYLNQLPDGFDTYSHF